MSWKPSWKPSPMLRYTLLRLALFAGCFAVIWGLVYVRVLPAGLGSSNLLWVILLALLITAPLSYVLLRKVRDEASVQVSERVASFAAFRAEEDEADDAEREREAAAEAAAQQRTNQQQQRTQPSS